MTAILTVTLNPAIDITADVDELVPDAKLRCANARYEPGGGGINVTHVIKELGGDSTAFVMAGGPTGAWLQAMLAERGIRHSLFFCEGATRPSFQIEERATGRMYRFVLPGPTVPAFTTEELLRALTEQMAAAGLQYVVASGSLPTGISGEFLPRLARSCAARGARLVVDTSGPALRSLAGAGVFLIKPDAEEIESLRDLCPASAGPPEVIARALVENETAEVVVVTLGPRGAIVVTRNETVHLASPTVVARSAVGAGDSFVGALTLALARGAPLHDACRFGIAAGAAAVMEPGTQLCRRADVEKLFKEVRAIPLA